MMILTPDAQTTEQVDKLLWTQPAIGFLPHCRAHHRLAPVTPIILDHVAEPVVHEQVLVNLCGDLRRCSAASSALIEIVSLDEADRELARNRFRFYRDRGYEIRTHDLSQLRAPSPPMRQQERRRCGRQLGSTTTCSASSTR